jgi:hypothetical protein
MRTWASVSLVVALVSVVGCRDAPAAPASVADPELLHVAVHHLTDVIVHDIFSPPQAARAYAYASIAAYETLRHDHPEFRSLAEQLNGLTPVPAPEAGQEISLAVASVHAFLTVGKALTFSQARMNSLRTEMHERVRGMGVPPRMLEHSVRYGDRVAEHVLSWSSRDNYLETRGFAKFPVDFDPGRWVPTPPAYMEAVEPHWGRIRPFTMDSASEIRPSPPLPFDLAEGSPFFQQVREVHETGVGLTDEQRRIAEFWDDNPYVMHVRGHAMIATKKPTPGGHWMALTAIASRASGADMMESAEAYVLTGVALADGFSSSWSEKYRAQLVRPVSIIHARIDPDWQPLLQTPPFPEYTSAHSVISTAVATVLTHRFGDDFAFDDESVTEYGIPARSFSSFEEAASEAAISRLYGGIHYRMAIEEGVKQGRRVGENILRRMQTRAAPADHGASGAPAHPSNDLPGG